MPKLPHRCGGGVKSALLAGLLAVNAAPANAQCELTANGQGVVAAVEDGETIRLVDGRQVRLINALAPEAAGPGRGRLAASAKALVARLAAGKPVALYSNGKPKDRYGRLRAHVFVGADRSGLWLQSALVSAGLARVYSFPDNHSCVQDLLALERQSRNRRNGLWATRAFAVRPAARPRDIARARGQFQVIEGKVVAVGKGKRWIYLNFGADWRSDFTASVKRSALTRFNRAGFSPQKLKDASVRVRGWVRWRNGPMIELSQPEQIELIGGVEANVPKRRKMP